MVKFLSVFIRSAIGSLILIFFAGVACKEPSAPVLSSINSVGPTTVEPGDNLKLTGSGYVEGPAHVTLEGLFKPAGLSTAVKKTVYLEGIASSEELIELQISQLIMRRISDQPVDFTGIVKVTFPKVVQLGTVEIVARSQQVQVSFRPTGGAIVSTAARARDAVRFLIALGIRSKPDDDLVVEEIVSGTAAERAGFETGDRILAVDGTPVAALTDLAGITDPEGHEFELVSSAGTIKKATLFTKPGIRLDPDEFAAIVLSSIALGLFLAFAAPSRRGRKFDEIQTNPVTKAMGVGLVSIPLLIFPAAAILSRSGVGVAVFMLGLNVLGLAGIALFGGGKPLNRIWCFFAHLLPLPVIIAVAGASGSAIGLFDVVASQQAAPWGWHVWSNPFALAAMLATLALLWPNTGGSNSTQPASVACWIAAIPAAMMVSAYFLGGWLVPGVEISKLAQSPSLLIFGCAIFFAKTWAVLLVSRWFVAHKINDRRGKKEKDWLGLRFIALAIAATLALGWIWADVPDAYRTAGQVLATAASVTFFTSFAIVEIKKLIPRRA